MELEKCPKCGSEDLYDVNGYEHKGKGHAIKCRQCKLSVVIKGLDGKLELYENRKDAVKAWNKRVRESKVDWENEK